MIEDNNHQVASFNPIARHLDQPQHATTINNTQMTDRGAHESLHGPCKSLQEDTTSLDGESFLPNDTQWWLLRAVAVLNSGAVALRLPWWSIVGFYYLRRISARQLFLPTRSDRTTWALSTPTTLLRMALDVPDIIASYTRQGRTKDDFFDMEMVDTGFS